MVSCVIVANAASALAAQSKSLIFIQTKLVKANLQTNESNSKTIS